MCLIITIVPLSQYHPSFSSLFLSFLLSVSCFLLPQAFPFTYMFLRSLKDGLFTRIWSSTSFFVSYYLFFASIPFTKHRCRLIAVVFSGTSLALAIVDTVKLIDCIFNSIYLNIRLTPLSSLLVPFLYIFLPYVIQLYRYSFIPSIPSFISRAISTPLLSSLL